MGLNCKVGDMAIVKRGHLGVKHAGKIVEVFAGPYQDPHGELLSWSVRFREAITLLDGRLSREASCPDAWLMPIRDPDDDAVDETLINNPVRHEVTA